jgi:hypothetical protein
VANKNTLVFYYQAEAILGKYCSIANINYAFKVLIQGYLNCLINGAPATANASIVTDRIGP